MSVDVKKWIMPRTNVTVTWQGANFQLKHRVRYKPLRQPGPTIRSVSEFVPSLEQPVQGCHTSSTLQRLKDSPHHYVTNIFSIQHSLLFFPPIPNLSCVAHPSGHQHTHSLRVNSCWQKEPGASKRDLLFIPHAWPQDPNVKDQNQNRKNSRELWYHLLPVKTTSGVKNPPQLQRDLSFWPNHLEDKDLSLWIPHITVTESH